MRTGARVAIDVGGMCLAGDVCMLMRASPRAPCRTGVSLLWKLSFEKPRGPYGHLTLHSGPPFHAHAHRLTGHNAALLRSAPANTRSSRSHLAKSSALASARAAAAVNGAEDLRPRFVACCNSLGFFFRFTPPAVRTFAEHAWHRRASFSARSALAKAEIGCEVLQTLQRSRTVAPAAHAMQLGSSFFCSGDENAATGDSTLQAKQSMLEPRHTPHLRTGLLSCFFEKAARGLSFPQPLQGSTADGSIPDRARATWFDYSYLRKVWFHGPPM